MTGGRADPDDIIDARIRFSEEILREAASNQHGQESQSRPHSLYLPTSPVHREQHQHGPPPRYTAASPTLATPLSPTASIYAPSRMSTQLYTIDSNTEGPSQPSDEHAEAAAAAVTAASRTGRPSWGGSIRGRGALHRTGVPEEDESSSSTQADAAQKQRNRLSRRSGVSFADEPEAISIATSATRPTMRFSNGDGYNGYSGYEGYDGITKTPGRGAAASARMAETRETLAHYRDWLSRQRKRQQRWTSGPYGRFKTQAEALYQTCIVEGLLRQKPLPPSVDGRHIPLEPGRARQTPLLDERSGRPYVSNFIRSSRYTVWDFLPKQLVFQFMKLANFYFLIISILQMIPGLSTTGTYTTIIPLLIFVCISMAKEGYDDYRRYRLDRVENRSTAWVLDPGRTVLFKAQRDKARTRSWMPTEDETAVARTRWQHARGMFRGRHSAMDMGGMTELASVPAAGDRFAAGEGEGAGEGADEGVALDHAATHPRERMPWAAVQWQDLRVGDIVRLRRDDSVPADIVVLHATGPNGIAYIETMALDGETNLKSKQACPQLSAQCDSLAGIAACNAEIVSEDPNLDLYNYEGRVLADGSALPLTLNQIIFRGSIVRNTAAVVGVVVNTGEECKIRMNTHRHKQAKAPAMQTVVNRIVVLLVGFVVLLSVGCTIGNSIWVPHYARQAWYLDGDNLSLTQIFFAFVIMFNTLIPLSLYVSLEIIKVGQMLLMQDVDMYDAETDTPMVVNTTTILENLGQVNYVFSDKTGTLTENKMRFRKMSVAGTAWLHDMDIMRDEAEKARKRASMSSTAADKGKRLEPGFGAGSGPGAGDFVRPTTPMEPADAPLLTGDGAGPGPGPVPRRSTSTVHWRSSVRPQQAQPERKTEELLAYMRQRPHTAFSRKARHFLLCMALCHTCLPETAADGHIDFQAASPDELALVQAARDLGYLLVDRPAQAIRLQTTALDGTLTTETYEVLDVIEFSSKRKRMSIVVRMPDGRICLFCKGADSVILPRLQRNRMAIEKASAVERRASKRKSVEQERALWRKSMTASLVGAGGSTSRSSLNLGRSATMRNLGRMGTVSKRSGDGRRSGVFSGEMDEWLRRRETEDLDEGGPSTGAAAAAAAAAEDSLYDDGYGGLVDEALAVNEGAVFERCFQHIDDFASEGLRTLLFAYRYVAETDYSQWRALYREATTSLVERQARIEAAAELLEQGLELAGATAIEDKLQAGVPETIDKLRRANMKIWMLTGDKRETAINIAHAARLCKPFSELYVLDAAAEAGADGLQERIASTLVDVGRGMVPHAVVVIDGQTLGVVEAAEEMRILFLDLVARVDAVLCCRASPAQKAMLVTCIRERVPSSITLAIGDGANDIAMLQAAHVGVGISGREGLQAARIADYAIAQFAFLQRLLLVHGRWNYLRTGRYILGTFWKEMLFYLVQALYQHTNGYTGTSLYESTSLTVFNTLFTSLPVILLGIFERDLRAETLLAVPELYASFGQRHAGFCVRQYVGWMAMAVCEACIIFFLLDSTYARALFTSDTSLYAMGSLAFTVCVVFINIKMLILEMHTQTYVTAAGFVLSVGGWFLWSILLSLVFAAKVSAYLVRGAFLHNFGRTLIWWATVLAALAAVVTLELMVTSLRRVFWATDQDLLQEMEHADDVRAVLRAHAGDDEEGGAAETGLAPAYVDAPEEARPSGPSGPIGPNKHDKKSVVVAVTPADDGPSSVHHTAHGRAPVHAASMPAPTGLTVDTGAWLGSPTTVYASPTEERPRLVSKKTI